MRHPVRRSRAGGDRQGSPLALRSHHRNWLWNARGDEHEHHLKYSADDQLPLAERSPRRLRRQTLGRISPALPDGESKCRSRGRPRAGTSSPRPADPPGQRNLSETAGQCSTPHAGIAGADSPPSSTLLTATPARTARTRHACPSPPSPSPTSSSISSPGANRVLASTSTPAQSQGFLLHIPVDPLPSPVNLLRRPRSEYPLRLFRGAQPRRVELKGLMCQKLGVPSPSGQTPGPAPVETRQANLIGPRPWSARSPSAR